MVRRVHAVSFEYPCCMALKAVKRRLGDVKPGDVLIDPDGRATTVSSVTAEETPKELYEMLLADNAGHKATVLADVDHIWPLDVSIPGRVPSSFIGEHECTTGQLAEWTMEGWQPALSPMMINGKPISWTVRSCSLAPASEASTKVKCVSVDSPTHSFLLAGDNADNVDVSQDDDRDLGLDSIEVVDEDTFRQIAEGAVPTHNCGGPLALDTVIPFADGTTTTMGRIQPGDVVLAPDGSPANVLSTSSIMDGEEMWELGFDLVDDEHPWSEEDLEAAAR